MIVREIVDSPFKVVANFDWINDLRDTHQFLKEHGDETLLKFFEASLELWIEQSSTFKCDPDALKKCELCDGLGFIYSPFPEEEKCHKCGGTGTL